MHDDNDNNDINKYLFRENDRLLYLYSQTQPSTQVAYITCTSVGYKELKEVFKAC